MQTFARGWPCSDNFMFVSTGYNSDVLNQAFGRTLELLFPTATSRRAKWAEPASTQRAVLTQLHVLVQSEDTSLHSRVNENYTLEIPESGPATLVAPQVWGALHGLETFAQLVQASAPGEGIINGVPLRIAVRPRW